MSRKLPLGDLLAVVLFAASASAQEAEVVATKTGFKPKLLRLRKGDTTHLVLKSGDGQEHCFAVDELRIEKRIRAGKPTPLDVTPERAGSFAFYDCLAPESEGLRGKFVVAE
jgi:plastocyanin